MSYLLERPSLRNVNPEEGFSGDSNLPSCRAVDVELAKEAPETVTRAAIISLC